jgi:hypothetical protein
MFPATQFRAVEQALGYARQAAPASARRQPSGALRHWPGDAGSADWAAVDRIAQALCAPQQRKAA